ncbi:hypothetical protein BD410DRAFT_794295 [Rickenella mellea]|uniref:Uncharacterized protein n=1 Tax=Rickenella mellea TaxID=50990 RepID=A0A4Y7PSB9_9AGAM|nr:hypothetical protein BD410DRAFT_794295 [Rickenella mellea]
MSDLSCEGGTYANFISFATVLLCCRPDTAGASCLRLGLGLATTSLRLFSGLSRFVPSQPSTLRIVENRYAHYGPSKSNFIMIRFTPLSSSSSSTTGTCDACLSLSCETFPPPRSIFLSMSVQTRVSSNTRRSDHSPFFSSQETQSDTDASGARAQMEMA